MHLELSDDQTSGGFDFARSAKLSALVIVDYFSTAVGKAMCKGAHPLCKKRQSASGAGAVYSPAMVPIAIDKERLQ